MMQYKLIFSMVLLGGFAMPIPATAQCAAQTLFSCKTGGKFVEVCLDGSKVRYAFGPKAAPEIQISTPLTDLRYRPWDGMGIMMSDAIEFTNGEYSYEVWASVEKMRDDAAPAPQWLGGVNVLKGADVVAYLDCDSVPDVYQLDSLYGLKQAAGQCFDQESQGWKTECSN